MSSEQKDNPSGKIKAGSRPEQHRQSTSQHLHDIPVHVLFYRESHVNITLINIVLGLLFCHLVIPDDAVPPGFPYHVLRYEVNIG